MKKASIAIIDQKDYMRERLSGIVKKELLDPFIVQFSIGKSFLDKYDDYKNLQIAPFDLVTIGYNMDRDRGVVDTIEEMEKRGYPDKVLLLGLTDLSYLDGRYLNIDKILFKNDVEGFENYLRSLKI